MSETDDPERKWTEGIDPALTFTREDVDALTVLLAWGTFTVTAQPEGRPPTVEERVRARDAIAKIRALLPA